MGIMQGQLELNINILDYGGKPNVFHNAFEI